MNARMPLESPGPERLLVADEAPAAAPAAAALAPAGCTSRLATSAAVGGARPPNETRELPEADAGAPLPGAVCVTRRAIESRGSDARRRVSPAEGGSGSGAEGRKCCQSGNRPTNCSRLSARRGNTSRLASIAPAAFIVKRCSAAHDVEKTNSNCQLQLKESASTLTSEPRRVVGLCRRTTELQAQPRARRDRFVGEAAAATIAARKKGLELLLETRTEPSHEQRAADQQHTLCKRPAQIHRTLRIQIVNRN